MLAATAAELDVGETFADCTYFGGTFVASFREVESEIAFVATFIEGTVFLILVLGCMA